MLVSVLIAGTKKSILVMTGSSTHTLVATKSGHPQLSQRLKQNMPAL